MKKTIAVIALMLLTVLLFAAGISEGVGYLGGVSPSQVQDSSSYRKDDRITDDMASLELLYRYLDRTYLYDIDYDAVYEAMATAMFEALDEKYTYYVVPDEAEEYIEDASGEYGGLGIYFSKTYEEYQDPEDPTTLYCLVTQVFPGTPAAKGGLRSKDLITHIDGQSVIELSANECSARMKGPKGSGVVLTIQRGDVSFDIQLKRDNVTVPTVEFTMLDGDVGYIRITEFIQSTAYKVYEAVASLRNQGAQSFVIDLRDNPGGEIEVALQIADMFVKDKDLLYVNYKDKKEVYAASESILVPDVMRVAVVINDGTASSAEILSSTLKDAGRAVIVGSTSYGKGIMQIISPFGDAYTSITTAEFTTGSGNTIHKVGVTPDIEVRPLTVSDEELEAYAALVSGDEALAFIDSHPDFSEDNIALFAKTFGNTGIRGEILEALAYTEYISRMPYEDQPLAETKYDVVLKAAVDAVSGR